MDEPGKIEPDNRPCEVGGAQSELGFMSQLPPVSARSHSVTSSPTSLESHHDIPRHSLRLSPPNPKPSIQRVLYMGGAKPQSEMESEKARICDSFRNIGHIPHMFIADDSNDLLKWLEKTNKEGKVFNLILIDVDPKDSEEMSVSNATKVRTESSPTPLHTFSHSHLARISAHALAQLLHPRPWLHLL